MDSFSSFSGRTIDLVVILDVVLGLILDDVVIGWVVVVDVDDDGVIFVAVDMGSIVVDNGSIFEVVLIVTGMIISCCGIFDVVVMSWIVDDAVDDDSMIAIFSASQL